MQRQSRAALVVLFCALHLACTHGERKGEKVPDSPANQEARSERPVPSGGYRDRGAEEPEIRATAERALVLLRGRTGEDELKLLSIEKAETQVVAGTKTRLVLQVAGEGGERTAKVVVYKDLEGSESLTSVQDPDRLQVPQKAPEEEAPKPQKKPSTSESTQKKDCQDGESRPSEDGCNRCSCRGGRWACTKRACKPTSD